MISLSLWGSERSGEREDDFLGPVNGALTCVGLKGRCDGSQHQPDWLELFGRGSCLAGHISDKDSQACLKIQHSRTSTQTSGLEPCLPSAHVTLFGSNTALLLLHQCAISYGIQSSRQCKALLVMQYYLFLPPAVNQG